MLSLTHSKRLMIDLLKDPSFSIRDAQVLQMELDEEKHQKMKLKTEILELQNQVDCLEDSKSQLEMHVRNLEATLQRYHNFCPLIFLLGKL